MFSILLVTSALFGNEPAPGPNHPQRPERDSYEEALAQIGRGADAQVRLALWCEAHGLEAERIKHLSLAVLKDPAHPLARALLGVVSYHGRWQRPEAVGAAVQANAARKAVRVQYEEKRDKLPATAEAHWKLALWCEENGLKAESLAHLRTVVRLDPAREAAWKRLGCKKHKDGRWLTDEQAAQEKEEAELQKKADKHWRPLLEKWRAQLAGKDPAKQAEARRSLAELTDPRAVPMIMAVLATGDESDRQATVQVLGQIDAPGASRALALLAVFSASAEVRRTAAETLAQRDVREFGNVLIGLLRDPIKYEVRKVGGPGSPGELFVHGKKANLKRLYSPPGMPNVPIRPGDRISYDANGLPVVSLLEGTFETGRIPIWELANPYYLMGWSTHTTRTGSSAHPQQGQNSYAMPGLPGGQWGALEQALQANSPWGGFFSYSTGSSNTSPMQVMRQIADSELLSGRLTPDNGLGFTLSAQLQIPVGQMAVEAQKTAVVAEQQLQNDVAIIDRYNEPIKKVNDRVVPILKQVARQDLGDDRETWNKWWINQIGYTIMPLRTAETPTIVENVPLEYQPQPVPINEIVGVVGYHQMSCFGAGTLVSTLTGLRPIEALQPGDEVLTQNTSSGALRYQPVLVVHRNPPAKTFRIAVGGETIVSSEFHRFWKAGKGWVMARDMKAGDALRTLGGVVKVDSLETGEVQPVFNLDVAEDADFFVGKRSALVHDNSLPDLRRAPFDAEPSLAAVSAP